MPWKLKMLLAGAAGLLVLAFSIYSATHSIDVEQLRVVGTEILRGDYHLYPAGVYEGREVHPHGFSYAPALAFLFAPLALAPLAAAAFLIFWLKIAAIVHVVVIVSRRLGVDRRRWWQVGGLAFLATAGYVLEEFRGGNIHFLTVWLVVVAIDRLERHRTVAAGAALAVAIAAKITPGLFLLPLLLKRQARALLATLGTLAGILLLPIAIVGVAMNTTLVKGFVLFARTKVNDASNEAFRGLFIHLLTANPVIGQGALRVDLTASEAVRVNLLWLVCSAAVLAVLIAVASRPAPDIERRMLTYSAVTMVILLVAPHTQRIYFCSLFFPCSVLSAMLLRPGPAPHRRLMQLTLLTAFCVSSLIPAVLPGRSSAFRYERLWPHAVMTLALLGVTLVVWRGYDHEQPAAPHRPRA